MHKVLFVVSLLVMAAPALAEEAKAQTTSITIYSAAQLEDFDAAAMLKREAKQVPGMAIVQQKRNLELNEGETTVALDGIAPAADFSTLSLRPLTADGFRVLSRSLIAPALDADSMLRRAVGHEIIINRKAPPIADHARTPETINAKLVAFDQNQLVVETNNRQLPVQIIPRSGDIAEIKLMADSAPITRATVSAQLNSAKAGVQEAILAYQTNGMTWHADYELLLAEDQAHGHFSGTITLINRTGTAFEDARVHLSASRNAASKEIYSLAQPATLAADAAQRVALLEAGDLPCQAILACAAADYSRTPTFATNYLAIENSSKNNLGRPLPAGRLRVIRQSSPDAAPTLLSDEIFPAIAADDLLLVRLGGEPSPVTIKREVVERLETDKAAANEIITITLRNRSNQPKQILLAEPRPSPAANIIEKSDEYQAKSQMLLFRVDVPAAGEKVVSYTLRRPAQ